MVLVWRWWMVPETVLETSRRRWIAVLVGRTLFKIIDFRHITVTSRLIAVLRSVIWRTATVAAIHAVVIVMIDRHLLLFTFGRFRSQTAHGRPAFVAAVLKTGHVQRPVLVAIVHVAATRLVFCVSSSHVRRRYWQQNVCQHPAAATRQRQRT